MSDEISECVNEYGCNIIDNIHPTEGNHWVLLVKNNKNAVYYFDSNGVETPPIFWIKVLI